jgi:hypothetical protein
MTSSPGLASPDFDDTYKMAGGLVSHRSREPRATIYEGSTRSSGTASGGQSRYAAFVAERGGGPPTRTQRHVTHDQSTSPHVKNSAADDKMRKKIFPARPAPAAHPAPAPMMSTMEKQANSSSTISWPQPRLAPLVAGAVDGMMHQFISAREPNWTLPAMAHEPCGVLLEEVTTSGQGLVNLDFDNTYTMAYGTDQDP